MFGLFNHKDKATDPVCRMKVDKQTEHSTDYQGNKYYFCSENCLKQFNADPKKYAQEETAAKSCCH